MDDKITNDLPSLLLIYWMVLKMFLSNWSSFWLRFVEVCEVESEIVWKTSWWRTLWKWGWLRLINYTKSSFFFTFALSLCISKHNSSMQEHNRNDTIPILKLRFWLEGFRKELRWITSSYHLSVVLTFGSMMDIRRSLDPRYKQPHRGRSSWYAEHWTRLQALWYLKQNIDQRCSLPWSIVMFRANHFTVRWMHSWQIEIVGISLLNCWSHNIEEDGTVCLDVTSVSVRHSIYGYRIRSLAVHIRVAQQVFGESEQQVCHPLDLFSQLLIPVLPGKNFSSMFNGLSFLCSMK